MLKASFFVVFCVHNQRKIPIINWFNGISRYQFSSHTFGLHPLDFLGKKEYPIVEDACRGIRSRFRSGSYWGTLQQMRIIYMVFLSNMPNSTNMHQKIFAHGNYSCNFEVYFSAASPYRFNFSPMRMDTIFTVQLYMQIAQLKVPGNCAKVGKIARSIWRKLAGKSRASSMSAEIPRNVDQWSFTFKRWINCSPSHSHPRNICTVVS